MPEPTLTRQQADAIVAADPEGPYIVVRKENGTFLALETGVTEDGENEGLMMVGRIVEGQR